MNSDVTDAHHILLLAKRDPPEIGSTLSAKPLHIV
jgi:hypothetical protein